MMNNGHMTTQHNTKPIAKSHMKHTCNCDALGPGWAISSLADTTATPRASSCPRDTITTRGSTPRHTGAGNLRKLTPTQWGRRSRSLLGGTTAMLLLTRWKNRKTTPPGPKQYPPRGGSGPRLPGNMGGGRAAWRGPCVCGHQRQTALVSKLALKANTHTPLGIERLALKHPSTHTPWALR